MSITFDETCMRIPILNGTVFYFVIIFYKRVLNYFIKPLTFLINQSFHNGIFPDALKLAKVIPIYKSRSTMELNNYTDPYLY